jgi:Mrp family chromosome partitioning ATPase
MGLQVLVAGPNAGNPVALLSTRRLAERLAELRAGSVSYIIIDAPPVLAVTDAALWASQVDGVVLLINAGATKRDQAERARQVLAGVQAQILGAVLLNAETTAASGAYAK